MKVERKFEGTAVTGRVDLYYAVHKGIRLGNMRMLMQLGALDPEDDVAVAAARAALNEHLNLAYSHLVHENREIHSAIEERCPGATHHTAEEHDHHEASFAQLRMLADELVNHVTDRSQRLRWLYQAFALFVAEDFQHMHEEETELMPLMWKHFTDAELAAIRQRIVTSLSPVMSTRFTRAILAAGSGPEREVHVTVLSTKMPQGAFENTMRAIVGHPWAMGNWRELERALC